MVWTARNEKAALANRRENNARGVGTLNWSQNVLCLNCYQGWERLEMGGLVRCTNDTVLSSELVYMHTPTSCSALSRTSTLCKLKSASITQVLVFVSPYSSECNMYSQQTHCHDLQTWKVAGQNRRSLESIAYIITLKSLCCHEELNDKLIKLAKENAHNKPAVLHGARRSAFICESELSWKSSWWQVPDLINNSNFPSHVCPCSYACMRPCISSTRRGQYGDHITWHNLARQNYAGNGGITCVGQRTGRCQSLSWQRTQRQQSADKPRPHSPAHVTEEL